MRVLLKCDIEFIRTFGFDELQLVQNFLLTAAVQGPVGGEKFVLKSVLMSI